MPEQFDVKGIEQSLEKPIAGMPGYVWVIGGALGILVVYLRRKKAAATTTATPGGDTSALGATIPTVGQMPDQSTSTTNNSTGPNPTITNNDDWYGAATRELLAEGYEPTVVDNALRKYLQSQSLNPNEAAVIEKAITKIGPPPQAVPLLNPTAPPVVLGKPTVQPVTGGSKPPVTQPAKPTTPPAVASVTIQHGDTLWDLVRKHYGRVTNQMVNNVAAYNGLQWDASHTHVTPFFAGQVIRFPAAA